jgi:cell division septation protein DedD
MENKNLNDIVIEDNDNSKKAQLKNILTLLALLFIILVISIVITKLILGNDEESNETNPAVSSTVVNGTNSSISGATAGVIGTTAALGTAAILANRASDKRSSLVDSETSVSKKVPLRDHRPTPKNVVKHTTTHRSTYVRTRHTPRPTPKPTPKPTVAKRYYIKVGAFKDPSNAIKAIKAHHLDYKTIDIKDGELTRVLVGPYSTQKDAQKDLDEVKAKISSTAYITKIK